MPRFAILHHDHPFPHWDFLLENGDACRTWRLLESPDAAATEIAAEELSDHRLVYLDYEGSISNGRGNVTRWDGGTFNWQINLPDHCDVILAGRIWQGVVRLTHLAEKRWICTRVG
jgi:hypothetical protein